MTEKTFVELLEKIFKTEGFLTKKEIGVGYGVADLVLISKDSVNINNCVLRKKHGQRFPLLNEKYFKTLKLVPNRNQQNEAVSFDYIAKRSDFSQSYLKHTILQKLEKTGYIKTDRNQRYFKVNGWLPIANEIIAIEAKLRNWKRGIIQANRYKAFANKVYLTLPEEIEHLVDKKYLRRLNIGLIIFDPIKMEKKVHLRSEKIRPFDENKYNLAAEYFWSRNYLMSFA